MWRHRTQSLRRVPASNGCPLGSRVFVGGTSMLSGNIPCDFRRQPCEPLCRPPCRNAWPCSSPATRLVRIVGPGHSRDAARHLDAALIVTGGGDRGFATPENGTPSSTTLSYRSRRSRGATSPGVEHLLRSCWIAVGCRCQKGPCGSAVGQVRIAKSTVVRPHTAVKFARVASALVGGPPTPT